MKIWLVTLFLGTFTLLWRTSFILWLSNWDPPAWFSQALRFVPAAAFAAIVAPAILRPDGGAIDLSLLNPRLLAAFVTILVAWRSKNLLISLIFGMVSFWLAIALLGRL